MTKCKGLSCVGPGSRSLKTAWAHDYNGGLQLVLLASLRILVKQHNILKLFMDLTRLESLDKRQRSHAVGG